MKNIDEEKIMKLARGIRNDAFGACQNAEHGNEKAVMRLQDAADAKLKELADYLGMDMWR
jgi:hypothetical protein